MYVLCDLQKGELNDGITGSTLLLVVVCYLLLTLVVSAPLSVIY